MSRQVLGMPQGPFLDVSKFLNGLERGATHSWFGIVTSDFIIFYSLFNPGFALRYVVGVGLPYIQPGGPFRDGCDDAGENRFPEILQPIFGLSFTFNSLALARGVPVLEDLVSLPRISSGKP